MPIYEYVCGKCAHHLEVMQKMSDKPLSKCPECRGKLEKIFSQTSFQLKGSGWYVSDYARSKPAIESKDSKDSKDSKGSKDTKDGKPETKAAAACASTGCGTGVCDTSNN